tara:strand:- start:1465 stop:2121 length:657 start_codon:yes stop_codon:yes gene_type:complete
MSSQIEIKKNLLNYLMSYGYRRDLIIDALIKETRKLGNVSQMQISAEQGQFMELIVKLTCSKLCLEIGRFTGLSSLCIAKGLPKGGKVITIDNSEEFLPIAKKYWKKAKVNNKIQSIIGEGSNTLKEFVKKKIFFDLIFIDADKYNYHKYYELSLNLLKSNGLMLVDNVLWDGQVAVKNNKDKIADTIHKFNKKILNDKRVDFSLIPLADGISLIRKI